MRLSKCLTAHLFKGFCQLVALWGDLNSKLPTGASLPWAHLSSPHWSVYLQAVCPTGGADGILETSSSLVDKRVVND